MDKAGQLIIITALFTLQYAAEYFFPQAKANNQKRNQWKNLQWGLLGWSVNILPAIALAKWVQWLQTRGLGLLQQVDLKPLPGIILFILLMDMWMYWWHRINHEWGMLWRFHRLHHTEAFMNTTSVLRFHFAELFFSNIAKAIVFLMLGPSVLMVAVYEVLFFANVLFHHSNISIKPVADGVYRLLFSSPLMHRLHHSPNKMERNSNYGSVFSFWDRLFSSYKNNNEPIRVFGVDDGVEGNAFDNSESKIVIQKGRQ